MRRRSLCLSLPNTPNSLSCHQRRMEANLPNRQLQRLWRIRQALAPLRTVALFRLTGPLDLWHEKCTSGSPPSSFNPQGQAFDGHYNCILILPSQKKGAQSQKTIARIKSQAADAKTPEQKRKEAEKAQREKEKAASEQAKREAAELFKPVQVQKVPFGVDPKTVLCIFFKQGNCEKGKKCKFSHDLAVERKGEKRDLYSDTRDKEGEDEAKRKDDMADWDEGEGVTFAPSFVREEKGSRGVLERWKGILVWQADELICFYHYSQTESSHPKQARQP